MSHVPNLSGLQLVGGYLLIRGYSTVLSRLVHVCRVLVARAQTARYLGFKSPLGWVFFCIRVIQLSEDSEDSDSLLHKPQATLQVPSGIVKIDRQIVSVMQCDTWAYLPRQSATVLKFYTYPDFFRMISKPERQLATWVLVQSFKILFQHITG